jgi:hypothetical protein
MVSSPNTKKLSRWIHPFGPASNALTGSAKGSYSPRRRASCAKKTTVKRRGPMMPAQAKAGNADLRRGAMDATAPCVSG